MPDTKSHPAGNGTASTKSRKKANLLDHHSIKHILDESVTEVVKGRGYVEDVRLSNVKLLLGVLVIIIALVAQFYPKKFPENRDILIGCIGFAVLQLIIFTKEKNAILFTYPPAGAATIGVGLSGCVVLQHASGREREKDGSFNSTGLVVSSKLPRFSDLYTLTIASADPESISAQKPVQFTKTVTQWFTKDGVLVEGLFWKDVDGLINDYANESKKSK